MAAQPPATRPEPEAPTGPASHDAELHLDKPLSCILQSRLLMLCAVLMMALMWSRYRQGAVILNSSAGSSTGSNTASSSTTGSGRSIGASDITSTSDRSIGASSPPSGSSLLPDSADTGSTLQFDVCNGFTNQRIALMSGKTGPATGQHPCSVLGRRWRIRRRACCGACWRSTVRRVAGCNLCTVPAYCIGPSPDAQLLHSVLHPGPPVGLVLAAETNRTAVLPDWLLRGYMPDAVKYVTADDGGAVPFG